MWLGSGVIGGIGLGLGYISPVSTLVKWFPDRRGMATGMAIMGFGGGAMIGAPLANLLMNYFKTPSSVGVWETFVAMGVIYFAFNQLTVAQKATIAGIAAGFTGLLSLFNIGGRFFWASLSDKIGRKATYYTFFILGIALYALAPTFAAIGSKLLFVLGFGIILSMYGGGFATVPAYLADMFGTQFVGAIHGRLLTAWSTAGIIGPVVVNYIREFQLAAGVKPDQLYNTTMYILCAMLIAGLICNLLIKPVDRKWHMSEADVAKLQAASASAGALGPSGSYGIGFGGLDAKAA